MSTLEAIDFAARVMMIVLMLVGWSRLNDAESAILQRGSGGREANRRIADALGEQHVALARLEHAEPMPRLYGRDPDA